MIACILINSLYLQSGEGPKDILLAIPNIVALFFFPEGKS